MSAQIFYEALMTLLWERFGVKTNPSWEMLDPQEKQCWIEAMEYARSK